MSALPAWAVERVAAKIDHRPNPVMSHYERWMCEQVDAKARAALAEFLAILEERGLRVVPVEAAAPMHEAGETMHWDCHTGHRDVWEAMVEAAPPLAELLEDRDGTV